MPITINGSTGIAGVDGSAGAPAVRGSDADSGVYFTGSQVGFSSNGSGTTMSIDASGNVTFPGTVVMSSPFAMRNKIINGAMEIDQRNNGAAITVNALAQFFAVDRTFCFGQSSDGVFTAQRSTDAPTGFINSLALTVTTADASIGASQIYGVQHRIEGFNIADLAWGTASAKTITLSFWVKSSVTGTFGGRVANAAANRTYTFPYTISATNIWEYKTVTIPGDTTGTWATDNTIGMNLLFNIGSGSNYKSTGNTWSNGDFLAPTGSVDLISTLNATWRITGVQLEVGSVATPFERRLYGTELQLAQRYYFQWAWGNGNQFVGSSGFGNSTVVMQYQTPVSMRVSPTVSFSNSNPANWQYYNASTSSWTNTTTVSALSFNENIYSVGLVAEASGGSRLIRNNSGATAFITLAAEL